MRQAEATTNLTKLLGSLAEPVRLRLLRILESEELSVRELAAVVQMPQSTVSRHLKILGECAWLAKRQAGTATYYRVVLDDLGLHARSLWLASRDALPSQLGTEAAEDDRRVRAVLTERMTDSASFFGRMAGAWDDMRQELFGRGFTADALLGLVRPDWTVADLGCGTGNASEHLAPVCERVVAVDVSEPMLDAAQKRLSDRPNVEFRAGELEQLPLDDNSVDAVVCVLVLHHMPNPEQVLAESARILRTDRGGGVLLIVDMAAHDRDEYKRSMGHLHLGFAPDELHRLFGAAGFGAVRVRDLPAQIGATGPGLTAATGWLGGEMTKH
ncbi:MAG: metalloregulator ArsR/SmtB family transcription factor [Planctomycetota bacterium]